MNKVANRRGSNIRLYKYTDGSLFMSIPFGRITAPDVSSDRVWARGGQADANMVPFDEPMTGTFTITTQIIPIELIALACSDSGATTGVDEWAHREVLTAEVVADKVVGAVAWKLAVTDLLVLIVTVAEVLVPLASPVQPVKVKPAAAVAVTVTTEPEA